MTPIALWDGNNNTIDSINGMNGVWNPVGADDYGTGYINNCFRFNITTAYKYVQVPYNPLFNFSDKKFELEFYHKNTIGGSYGGRCTIGAYDPGVASAWSIYLAQISGAGDIYVSSGSNIQFYHSCINTINVWRKIKLTYDNGRFELYIDELGGSGYIQQTPDGYINTPIPSNTYPLNFFGNQSESFFDEISLATESNLTPTTVAPTTVVPTTVTPTTVTPTTVTPTTVTPTTIVPTTAAPGECPKIYITQSTNIHVVKRLDSSITPALYDGVNYGLFGEEGRLDFPTSVASNGDYIFVCDYKNERIIKFDKDLNFLSEYLCNSYKPYLIFYDANYTNDLYVLGIVVNRLSIKIERLSVDLVSSKISDYIGTLYNGLMPTGFCKSSNSADILVTGCDNDILISTETYSTFTSFANKTIGGLTSKRYMGIINNGNNIFLNDGTRIIKTDSTNYSNIVCIGRSNIISKTTAILKEAINGTMLIVDEDALRILRYDQNLNFVSEVYKHTGSTIALDANSITDFIEFDVS